MSDFSSAIMLRTANKEIPLKYTEDGVYLVKLNDAWICRLSEKDFCDMSEENYSDNVLELSAHIPLMHVMNAEDHGFGLGILHNKKLVFRFNIAYGIESEFAFDIGQELYGDEYMDVIFDPEVEKKVQDEVKKRYHEVEEKLKEFFKGIGKDEIKQFKLFGFNQDDCAKIQNILTISNYQRDKMGYQMIQELFAVLGIEKFSFVSHNYVNSNEGIFDIIR